eukprot:2493026-Pyramimonas_sp.AAC.1
MNCVASPAQSTCGQARVVSAIERCNVVPAKLSPQSLTSGRRKATANQTPPLHVGGGEGGVGGRCGHAV